MRRTWITALGVLTLGLGATPAFAADHKDGAAVKTDPTTDITDVYSWMSADKSKVYLVMNVNPAADMNSKFSNAAQYVFHINAFPGFFKAPKDFSTVLCTFDNSAKQVASCWLEDKTGKAIDYVNGDLSNTAGTASVNGKMKVFTGLRDDPFFFNLVGFQGVAADVATGMACTGACTPKDANGCPTNVKAAEAMKLAQGANGGAPTDTFGTLNVLSIVIAVDAASVTTAGANPVLGVWGSTNK